MTEPLVRYDDAVTRMIADLGARGRAVRARLRAQAPARPPALAYLNCVNGHEPLLRAHAVTCRWCGARWGAELLETTCGRGGQT